MRFGWLIFLGLTIVSPSWSAEDIKKGDLNCGDPLNSSRVAVKKILDPLYQGQPEEAQLRDANTKLDKLSKDAAYCRLQTHLVFSTQEGDDAAMRQFVAEWGALNQWLGRLAGAIERDISGAGPSWREEYDFFAEIYEFEI